MRQQNSTWIVHLNDNYTPDPITRSVVQGNTSIGNVNMGKLPDNRKWMLTFILEYDSGFLISNSATKDFSKTFPF